MFALKKQIRETSTDRISESSQLPTPPPCCPELTTYIYYHRITIKVTSRERHDDMAKLNRAVLFVGSPRSVGNNPIRTGVTTELVRWIILTWILQKNNKCIKTLSNGIIFRKNTETHTAHNIVSWPNPIQWVIVHTSDLMMIIRQSIYILSIITREMGNLKTHSPIYCIMDNWENMPYLTYTLDKIYLTGIL